MLIDEAMQDSTLALKPLFKTNPKEGLVVQNIINDGTLKTFFEENYKKELLVEDIINALYTKFCEVLKYQLPYFKAFILKRKDYDKVEKALKFDNHFFSHNPIKDVLEFPYAGLGVVNLEHFYNEVLPMVVNPNFNLLHNNPHFKALEVFYNDLIQYKERILGNFLPIFSQEAKKSYEKTAQEIDVKFSTASHYGKNQSDYLKILHPYSRNTIKKAFKEFEESIPDGVELEKKLQLFKSSEKTFVMNILWLLKEDNILRKIYDDFSGGIYSKNKQLNNL